MGLGGVWVGMKGAQEERAEVVSCSWVQCFSLTVVEIGFF